MDRRDLTKAMGAMVAGVVAGSRGVAHAEGPAPSSRVAKVRQMIEGDGLDELVSPTHQSHKPWDLAVRPEMQYPDLDSVFSGLQLSVVDAVEGGDKVVVRWRLRGTMTGAFAGIQPTGQPVDVTGINIYRFVGDTIVESWGELDVPSLAQQAFGSVAAEDCQEALQVLARPAGS